MQHFHSIIFQDLKQLNWNSINSTSFVRSEQYEQYEKGTQNFLLLPWLMLIADRLIALQGLLEKHARLKGLNPNPWERDGLRQFHMTAVDTQRG